jgi:hypothetical protein
MRVVKNVALVIVKLMHDRVGWPATEHESRLIAAGFANKARPYKMPNVCGCIDGTQIEIAAPAKSGGAFVNRYSRTALNVLGRYFLIFLGLIF